ncbi:hypothetical protein [Streptomyces virginiae]|uniref:hypothetical protein n=1 Tax=Streptomyces virginiae TaxID=1961 RepID=UPI00341EEB6F
MRRAPDREADARAAPPTPPTDVLHGIAPRFGHHIVSSTRSGDSAAVDVDLSPTGGHPVAVVLELRRSGDRWDVCTASTGRMAIAPALSPDGRDRPCAAQDPRPRSSTPRT